MRRAFPLLILAITVSACQDDSPVEPTILVDPEASAQAPPDLSDQLPGLERRVFIHYRRGFEKPDGVGNPGGGGSRCYSLLANGAHWKTIEPYQTTFSLPVATWEFNNQIFGRSQGGPVPPFDDDDMDGINTAQFGSYPNPNVIAITVVWGIFAGPPAQRELVEWDLLLNSPAFDFGDAENDPSLMDTEAIATHELGHAAGLGHPGNGCTEETMYAFADHGEIKKRTLEDGDRAGIIELY
jgi:hypothetical protein